VLDIVLQLVDVMRLQLRCRFLKQKLGKFKLTPVAKDFFDGGLNNLVCACDVSS